MTIGEAIKKARHKKCWYQRELAANSNIGLESIGSYEIDEHVPRLDAAIMLADSMGISLQELLTGKVSHFKNKPLTSEEMGLNAKRIRGYKLLSRKQLSEKALVSTETIRRFECGETYPQTDMLLSICKALGVTVDEYIGRV